MRLLFAHSFSFLELVITVIKARFRPTDANMSDEYMALHDLTEQTYFEHFQKLASMTSERAEFALGADEGKQSSTL